MLMNLCGIEFLLQSSSPNFQYLLQQLQSQIMSIYSGFATRQQQETYDQSISSFLYILQKRIVKFFKSEPANDLKFIELLTKIYNNLRHMQESKYLEPKLSNSVSQLMQYLKQKRVQLGGALQINKQKTGSRQHLGQQRKKVQKKVFTNSKSSLQAINIKRQKINVTQRVAFKTTQKQSSSQLRNTIIKKRKTTNVNNRSSIENAISDYPAINGNEEQNFRTQKAKYRLDDQLSQFRGKNNYRQKSQNKKQSKAQLGSIKKQQKVDSQQEVRELIKGYLVKKKKGRDTQKTKIQIQQIFKVD